jgi:hypothetical protein
MLRRLVASTETQHVARSLPKGNQIAASIQLLVTCESQHSTTPSFGQIPTSAQLQGFTAASANPSKSRNLPLGSFSDSMLQSGIRQRPGPRSALDHLHMSNVAQSSEISSLLCAQLTAHSAIPGLRQASASQTSLLEHLLATTTNPNLGMRLPPQPSGEWGPVPNGFPFQSTFTGATKIMIILVALVSLCLRTLSTKDDYF